MIKNLVRAIVFVSFILPFECVPENSDILYVLTRKASGQTPSEGGNGSIKFGSMERSCS
jgi:hypothetical protein